MSEHTLRVQTAVAVSPLGGQLIGPNPNRIGLIISCPITDRVSISFRGPVNLDSGINLYSLGPPLVLLSDVLGDALHEEIWGIANATILTICIVEFVR